MRNYKNINDIPREEIYNTFKFCFTFVCPKDHKIPYVTQTKTYKRRFHSVPFNGQKTFLLSNIDTLSNPAYYFEQHIDGRYHLHGFVEDTALNVLIYMKKIFSYQFNIDKNEYVDLQNKLLLVEVVACPPFWVDYCLKHQTTRDLFLDEIEKYNNNQLDYIKIDVNPLFIPHDNLSDDGVDYSIYRHNRNKFILEL